MLYKNWQIIKLYLLLLLFPGNLLAQNYTSKQITTSDGLPDNNVCAILKDKSNNLWVGTQNGLALLKNKTVTIYKKKDGLAHNSCWALAEDNKGQIWIGTYGGGISLFSNGKFKNFSTKEGLPSNKIRKFLLHNNYLYVGTANGFCSINTHTHKIKNYVIKDLSTHPGDVPVRDFEVLNINLIDKTIIINTHSHGIYKIKNNSVEVLNKSLYVTFSTTFKNQMVYIAKNGHVDNNKSLYSIELKDFIAGKSNLEPIPSPNTIFWNFIKTNNNTVYGGADGVEYDTGGLYEIGSQIRNVTTDFGIKNRKIWSLYYDKIENQIYVGTLGDGLYIVDLDKKIYAHSSIHTLDIKRNNFFQLAILTPENIQIKTKLDEYNFSKNELYERILNLIKKLPGFWKKNCDANISILGKKGFLLKSIKLVANEIEINTNFGLLKLKFNSSKIEDELLFHSINNYNFISQQELFFYYPYFGIVYIPDIKKQNDFISFDAIRNPTLPKNILEIIKTENNIFFISSDKGIYYFNYPKYKDFKFKSLFKSMEWKSCYLLSNHQILLSSIDGDIYILDDKQQFTLTKIIKKQELIGNTIYKVLSYKNHVLVVTDKGLNAINLKSKRSYFIDNEMGLNYQTVYAASIYNNQLLLATDKGGYELSLKKYIKSKSENEFPFNLQNIIINDTVVNFQSKLNYKENKLQFQLSNSFYLYPKKLVYQYYLKGLKNADWSSWTNSNEINFNYLPTGKFELWIKYKDLSKGTSGIKMLKQFEIEPPFWETWYFIISSVALTVIFIIVYVNRKIKNIKARALEKTNYEKRIVETKMEALQSQMNPHFVFNSLNVIQNFVIQNDTENSITYINNFSKLMRKTLEHSSEFKITINEEIKFIKLYVEVQNIRFNNKVKFITKVDSTIDKFKKLVPPMLIQPLIENCFQHAFNESISTPKITLTIKSNDTQLIVSVTDNGTGFRNSSNIKKQSKALKLVEERIKLLDDKNSFIIKHLSTGVEVEITLNN